MVTALVSGDLEGEPLLGWQTMKSWCLLSKMFPKVEDYDDIPDEEEEGSHGGVDVNDDKVKSVRNPRVDFSLDPGSVGADSNIGSSGSLLGDVAGSGPKKDDVTEVVDRLDSQINARV